MCTRVCVRALVLKNRKKPAKNPIWMCVRACVRVCVRACVRACVRVCVCVFCSRSSRQVCTARLNCPLQRYFDPDLSCSFVRPAPRASGSCRQLTHRALPRWKNYQFTARAKLIDLTFMWTHRNTYILCRGQSRSRCECV